MKGAKIITLLQGYDYIKDPTGKTLAIQRSTGEIFDTTIMPIINGSTITTPEAKEWRKKYAEREFRKRYIKQSSSDLGKFFFICNKEEFKNISLTTLTRLIYLNTFLSYNSNQLMLTQKTPMYRNDLSQVLRVSTSTANRFLAEVFPTYIVTNNGLLFSNKEIFVKGNLKSYDRNNLYRKFYVDGVRKLYKSTDKHKHLGYIFKMLPYINMEFNTLCFNPLETNVSDIEFMTITDFFKKIKYDTTHANRLFKSYQDMYFDINGKKERFCSFVFDESSREKSKIYINPHIFYSGSDYRKVELLGGFCKE